MSAITFPALGLELNPPRGFTIPGTEFTIYFYGVIIALGLVLSVIYGLRRSHEFGLKQDDILDGVLWIVPLSIICARAYYVIFEIDQYKTFADVINIRKGGLAIYGGVIGAALGVIIFAKVKKVSLPAVLDLVAISFLIGQSIGRWGNFINREAYGAPTESFLRMGLVVGGEQGYYHPTFLYESVWNAIGFVLLHFLSKKRQYNGQMALGYAAWYGLGRAVIEGLRMDSLYWGPFRVSQLLAAVSCMAAVVALLILNIQRPKQKKPVCAAETEQTGETIEEVNIEE